MVFKGNRAALLAGFRTAAELGKWISDTADASVAGTFRLDAEVLERNEFWMNHQPKYLEVLLGKKRFKWKVSDLVESTNQMCFTLEGQWADSLLHQKASGSSSKAAKAGSKSKKSSTKRNTTQS